MTLNRVEKDFSRTILRAAYFANSKSRSILAGATWGKLYSSNDPDVKKFTFNPTDFAPCPPKSLGQLFSIPSRTHV